MRVNGAIVFIPMILIVLNASAETPPRDGNCEQALTLLNEDPKPDYNYANTLFGNCNCFEGDITRLEICYNKVKKSCDQLRSQGDRSDSVRDLCKKSENILEKIGRRIGPPPGDRECVCLWDGSENSHIAEYDMTIELDHSNATAWNDRGVLLADMCCYEEALESFEESIRIDPDLAEPWYNKGVLLYWSEPHKALRCFNQTLKLNPNFAEAWFNRCRLLMPDRIDMADPSSKMAYEESMSSYENATKIMPELGEPPILALKRIGE
jgi:tetratricopeptide (TPR) repeat protein